MTIYFYRTGDLYGCFSNFAHYEFEVNGIVWRTSEHFFQAHKFIDKEYFERIRMAFSPMDAATLGRSRKIPIRPDWEEIKDDIMRKAVFEKFSQNTELKDILINTGEQEIVEATTTDYYWGCGNDGTGKNMLGKILMQTREILKIGGK